MINGMVASTISQNGLHNKSPLAARRKAGTLFSQVLSRGRRWAFWSKLSGRDDKLKDFADVEKNTRRLPAQSGNPVSVPLEKIVGSEGRTHDFDRHFRPLTDHIRDRWLGIAAARRQGVILPPVELIQVGDKYFVRDGHHRISVARALGQAEIEAVIVFQLVK